MIDKAVAASKPATVAVQSAPVVDGFPDFNLSDEPLYGNLDEDEDFDLRKLTNLQTLPTDKVVVVIPEYNISSKGKRLGYDLDECRVQFIDPLVYDDAAKTDANTGSTAYQMLSVEPIAVHDPRKK